jgi:hypothetical protein
MPAPATKEISPNSKSPVNNDATPFPSPNAAPTSDLPEFIHHDLICPVNVDIKHHVPPQHPASPSTDPMVSPLIFPTTTDPNINPATIRAADPPTLNNIAPLKILQLSNKMPTIYTVPLTNPAHHPLSCTNNSPLLINGPVLIRFVDTAQCSIVSFPSSLAAVEDATAVTSA